jgi:hypothetical protein
MKKDYTYSLRRWSKRFATLLPLWTRPSVAPVHLPRLMCPDDQLPPFVRHCPTTMMLIPKFRLLAWEQMAQPLACQWFGKQPAPLSAYVGAFLVKIDQKLASTSHLRRFFGTAPSSDLGVRLSFIWSHPRATWL